MSQRRLHPKATPPEGFLSKRPTGFVARRSQTATGMLPPRASSLGLLLKNRGLFNLRISSKGHGCLSDAVVIVKNQSKSGVRVPVGLRLACCRQFKTTRSVHFLI